MSRGIGEVVADLSGEFPELRESKVRFLESRGLITPTRTASGYRRYDDECVDRIRTILRLQRDNFWPLRVIADHLAATDASLPDPPQRVLRPLRKGSRITAATVAARSGVTPEVVAELVTYGLLTSDADGRFDDGAVEICEAVGALGAFGIQPRHLRSSRVAADREVGLARQARTPADRSLVVAHLVALHEALIRTGLSQS